MERGKHEDDDSDDQNTITNESNRKFSMRGPTKYSNWIVKDSLLVGAHPKNVGIIRSILQQGIHVFVCLMQDSELQRSGKHYFEIAKSLAKEVGDESIVGLYNLN